MYSPACWEPGKEWTATGETSLGPNTAGISWCTMPGVSVYQESSWSMSNWRTFLIRSVHFCRLAAGCVCRVLGSTNWIWPSSRSGSDCNTGLLNEVVNELVGCDTAKLNCHQSPGTLTIVQLPYILRGMGFEEKAADW